jgi:hypothetical protein
MSKNITVTVQDSVYDTLKRRIDKLATMRVPGMNISKSNYVSIAIKEKLLRDGEVLEEDIEKGIEKDKREDTPVEVVENTNRLPIAIITES